MHELASSRSAVPNISVENVYLQHFFKAQSLRTELQVCR